MKTFLILFFVVMFFYVWYLIRSSGEAERKTKRIADEKGALFMTIVKHLTGLPIGEGIACKIYALRDEISIEGAGSKFIISRNKITSVDVSTETEITKQSVSSAGGAIGGALLFGPVGAMIGGRAKTKTTATNNYYMIISYVSNGEPKHVAFDLESYLGNAYSFVEEYKPIGISEAVEL